MTGVLLEDCQTQMRRVRNRLVPVAVWRNGKKINVEVAGSDAGEWLNKDNEYLQLKQRTGKNSLSEMQRNTTAVEHYSSSRKFIAI